MAFTLFLSTPALAVSTLYYVQGTGDAPIAGCAPIDGTSSSRCDTLRAAVAAANANAGGEDESDVIFLQAAGTYQLTQPSELALTDNVTIVGRGPRTTSVAGNGSTRVFSVTAGVSAGLVRLAVVGGDAPAGEGGNILNVGALLASQVRVTGGAAGSGGGIANYGLLSLHASLVDNNDATSQGGGILNRGVDGAANLSLNNTTVAFNRVTGIGNGAGVASTGSNANFTTLAHATIARNQIIGSGSGAGIWAQTTGETVFANGSIVANNTGGANCAGGGTFTEAVAGSNVTDVTGCSFSLVGTIGLGALLSDQGGDTDVLTIDPALAAKAIVATCAAAVDQRNAPRPTNACDAGAFQQGAVAPPIDSGPPAPEPVPQPPVQTPTPAPPVQTPTPTPTPEPTPEFRQSVVVEPVRGTVLVCPTRPTQCTPLRAGDDIRFGSTIDTRKGEVELTSLASAGGKPQTARFKDGLFKVVQSGAYTELQLNEELDCRSRAARTAQKKPKARKLWGDGKGKFRTKGRYAAATVRGTKWLVQDTCTTTVVRVTQGAVTVRDQVRKRNVVVRKGKSYTARARR